MNKQLKYSIFCNRKRFNVINWLKAASEKTYPAFCNFLNSRNVLPPDEDYFNRALSHFNSTLPPSPEPSLIETHSVKEEVIVPVVQKLEKEVEKEKQPEETNVETEHEANTQTAEETPPENITNEPEEQLDLAPLKEIKKATRRKRRRKSADVNNEN